MKKTKRPNRVLVLDGGGMQGAYMAGVLMSFYKHGIKADFFDCIVATSAGAYDVAYFLTGQMDEGARIWTEHIPNGLFKSKNLIPRLDLKYLSSVLTKVETLDVKAIKKHPTKFYVTLSDIKTLKPHYILLNKVKNPINVLLAGTAMPFFSNRRLYNGRYYYDGGLTAQPPLEFAKKMKPKEIWVLLSYPYGYRLNNWIYRMAGKFLGKNSTEYQLIAGCPSIENKTRLEIEKDKNLIVIRPKKKLPVNWLDNNADRLKQTLKIGLRDGEKFVKKFKKIIQQNGS